MAMTTLNVFADHGGGNGGDDMELALKKKALQIGYFIKSDMGAKVFKTLNGNALMDTVNTLDIDVVTGNVVDKYGTLRTCVNEPERQIITCNVQKISELGLRSDILTATLFHEILGLMELELGYQTNVSMYPISSKIIPYNQVIEGTPITEAQVKPEYFGLDNRSYGLTIENKKTHETLRMICLNNNIEIHRCRNFSIVRNAQKLQSPLLDNIISISPGDLKKIQLNNVTNEDAEDAIKVLDEVIKNGFNYKSFKSSIKVWRVHRGEEYRYGFGINQACIDDQNGCSFSYVFLGIPFLAMGAVDTVAEVGKQAINIAIYPVKALVNGIRVAVLKGRIGKFNKQLTIARDVLNLDNDLSKVGTSRKISNKDYQQVIKILQSSITISKAIEVKESK